MKRMWLAALAALCAALLCGCMQLDVDTGVDGANNAYLTYYLALDTSELDARQRGDVRAGVQQLAQYYEQTLGFAVTDESDEDGQLAYTFEKVVPNDTPKQAFDALEALLTDERQTVFLQVEMAQTQQPHQQYYSLAATADMGKLAALSNIEAFPTSMRDAYAAAVPLCTGTMRLTLPASEVSASSGPAAVADGLAVLEAPLSFTQAERYELATLRNLVAGAYVPLSADELAAGQRQKAWAAAAVCAVGLLAAAVGFVLYRRQKKMPGASAPPAAAQQPGGPGNFPPYN